MDVDVELMGSGRLVEPDAHHLVCAARPEELLFAKVAGASQPSHSHIFNEGRSSASGSSLIEEAWISDLNAPECDHYLEHRLMAQEYEGLRMGRELHDSTGQLLLSLRLGIGHLKRANDPRESEVILDEISETVRQIDQEIRAFSYLHYPADLGQGGLVSALGTLARGFGDRTGLKIVFKAVCHRTIANAEASVALLRVAQEALMNVHRHAHAGSVRMNLVDHGDMLELSVQDDGQGIPPLANQPASKGVGLPGMRHRIERLGGQFSVRRLKQGTKVVAKVLIGQTLAT